MTSFKQGHKMLAVLLVFVMFLTNPAFIGPIYAAMAEDKTENSIEGFNLDANKDVNKGAGTVAEDNTADKRLTEGEKVNRFVNRLVPYFLKGGKKDGPEWLKTTDFQLSFAENYKPMYTLTTVQPFGKVNDNGELVFWQGRYANQGDDRTANLGLGWRKLSADKQQMTGLNLFYDYGFKYNLSRIGAGAEYFNKLAEYRANVYIPTSGDKLTGVTHETDGILYSYIRAVPGFDFEAGTSFAHARWLSLYASGYFYNNEYQENETGYRLRGVFKLSSQFTLEAGYDRSNLSSGSFYGKFAYKLASGFGPSLKDNKEDKIDLSSKFLQKVERNNTIKTETFNKLVTYQGSITVYATNSSSHALYGAKVQAYQNGSPVGAPAVTNAAGIATISGLNSGTYTVRATYFSTTQDSASVSVNKGQTSAASVQLPVSASGGAQVKVLSAAGQAVSGAAVTLEQVSHAAAPQKSWLARLFGIQRAYAAGEPFTLKATSGADGSAVFKDLPPGTYTFTISYNGQIISSNPLTVEDGKTVGTDVVLLSGGSDTGSAAITVKDAKGVLSGAKVTVVVNGVVKSAATNADGVAAFGNLPAGNYTFTASKDYYETKTATVMIKAKVSSEGAITINKTQAIGYVKLKISPSGLTPTFKEGGTVLSYEKNGDYYTITMPVGSHVISVDAETYAGTVTTTIDDDQTDTQNVTLVQHTVKITVTNGASINPTFSEGGKVLTPALVSGNVYTFVVTAGADHTIMVSAAGYKDAVVTFVSGGTDAQSVTLQQRTVTITVTNGASVNPTFSEGGKALTPSSVNGNDYTFSVATGVNHTIIVSATGYKDAAVTFTISGGDTQAVTLGQRTVSITVTNGASINPTFSEGGTTLTPTLVSGNVYTFSVSTGVNHTITVLATGYKDGTVTFTSSGGDAQSVTLVQRTVSITVTNGASINPTFSEGGNTLTPTLVSGNVYTFTVAAGVNHTITVSAAGYKDGTVTFTSSGTDAQSVTLAQRTVTITLTNTGIAPTFREGGNTLTPLSVSGDSYTFGVTAGVDHTIIVSATGYKDGIVTFTSGGTDTQSVTLVQRTVSITVTNPGLAPTFKEDGTVLTPTTASNGVYTFSVATGVDHTITVSVTGYKDGTVTFTSSGGDTQSVTLVQRTVSITVTNPGITPTFSEGGTTLTPTTASSGVYTFTVTTGVDHTITVSATGYKDGTVIFTSSGGDSQSVTLVQRTVTITVTNTGITPTFSEGGTTLTPTSASNGVYTFTVTAGATHIITVLTAAAGYKEATATFTSSGADVQTVTLAKQTYTIMATVTGGGSITPQGGSAITSTGTTTVEYGSTPIYTITANSGYSISSIMVDGTIVVPVTGSPQTYTFSSVTSARSIAVVFVPATYTVTIQIDSTYNFNVPNNGWYVRAYAEDSSGTVINPNMPTATVSINTTTFTAVINNLLPGKYQFAIYKGPTDADYCFSFADLVDVSGNMSVLIPNWD